MKTTFFLGAGASKAFDYPTTVEFMEIAKILEQPFTDVVAFLSKMKKTVDIEMVLGELQDAFTMLQEIRTPGRFKQVLFSSGAIGNLGLVNMYAENISKRIREVNGLVYDTYWKEPNETARETYRALASAFGPALDIFSTNYDLCVEDAFSDDKYDDRSFTDGFGYHARNIKWNPELFDGSLIRLYKLHGSVNWKRAPSGELWKSPVHDRTEEKDHVILYPGFKGEPSGEPFIFLHSELGRKLKTSDFLVVIGFSFRDEYINRIISSAMKENRKLQIIIWNPVIPPVPFDTSSVISYDKYFDLKYIDEVKSIVRGENMGIERTS